MSHQETVNFIIMMCVSVLMLAEAVVVWHGFRLPGRPAMCLALFVGGVESLCYALVFWSGHGPTMLHLAAITRSPALSWGPSGSYSPRDFPARAP